jgi:hypothetical protein
MIDELLEEYPDPTSGGGGGALAQLTGALPDTLTRPRPEPRVRPEAPDLVDIYSRVQAAAPRPPRDNPEGALARIMDQAGALADKQMAARRAPRNDGFAFAAAMLAPTKTGHFSEALSRGLGVMAEGRAEDAKLREQYMGIIMKGLMPTTVGRSLMQPLTGQVVGTDPSVADERAAKIMEARLKAHDTETARMDMLDQRDMAAWNAEQAQAYQRERDRQAAKERADAAAAAAKERADQLDATRRLLAENRPARSVQPLELDDTRPGAVKGSRIIVDANDLTNILGTRTPPPKPAMPPAAMKEHLADFSDLGRLDQLDADTEKLIEMIRGKHIDFGIIGNTVDNLRNWVGEKSILGSSPSSRNYASFKAWIEQQRNAVLLQNKGVQTEGDAIRAALEGIGSANDPDTVLKRLLEIQKRSNNARSVLLDNISQRNENFGGKAYDPESRKKIEPSIIIDYGKKANEASGKVNDVAPSNRGANKPKPSGSSDGMPEGFSWGVK